MEDNKPNLLASQLENEEKDLVNYPQETQFEYYKLKSYAQKADKNQLLYIALKFIALYLKQRAIVIHSSNQVNKVD